MTSELPSPFEARMSAALQRTESAKLMEFGDMLVEKCHFSDDEDVREQVYAIVEPAVVALYELASKLKVEE